ncbi:MAG: hypothetical protein HYR88_02240 [Verrucomicrobia bacterium]|nr:hypothetical protein [Verrucomicrobiota bacterium]
MPSLVGRALDIPGLLQFGAELQSAWANVAIPELLRRGPLYGGKEKAYLTTMRRMGLWMGSMQLYRDATHHQAAAAGARALFELFLDMRTLAGDTDGSMLKKFEAFAETEHFRVSQKLVDFWKRHPSTPLRDIKEREAYVWDTARRDRISDTCRTLWGKDPAKDAIRGWPKHWVDQGAEQRARAIDAKTQGSEIEELCVLAYPQLSFFLHSGEIGLAQQDGQDEAMLGFSHAIAAQSFLSALATLGTEMSIDPLHIALREIAERWKAEKAAGPSGSSETF